MALWSAQSAGNDASGAQATDAARFAADYPQTAADNLFTARSAEQAVSILEAGTGVVFFGFPECPWCQEMAPMIDDAAREAGLTKVFYVSIRQDRADNTPAYQELVAMLGDNLDFDDEGRPRIFVPDVTVVVGGEIVGHLNDTATYSGDLTPAEYWTPELRADLASRFADMFAKVVDAGGCVEVCNL
jgi:thiol-disulfide isomerase/thioredoxin